MIKSYHIGLSENYGARYAIIPGDPGRVEVIAEHLDNPHFLMQNREYTSWIGTLSGEKVIVMSTGIGGPSTAIAVEELQALGVDTFIRVGTCGGMQKEVLGGDIVIATGAIRMEGTTKEYAPIEFPAVADLNLASNLVLGAKILKLKYHTGVVECKDSFYGQHSPERMPVNYELENKWQAWLKLGCIASEMESAALFVISSYLGARAASVFSCVWNQERAKAGLDNPECHDQKDAIRCAIEALKITIEGDKNS